MTLFRTCVNLLELLQLLLGLSQLLQKLFATSARAITAFVEAVATSAGVVTTCAEVVAASVGTILCVFG